MVSWQKPGAKLYIHVYEYISGYWAELHPWAMVTHIAASKGSKKQLESPTRPCPSSTPLSMICLRGLPENVPVSPTATRNPPSPAEKFRPPSVCFCPVSWPSTLWVRAPRLSPSTPVASKLLVYYIHRNCSFRATPSSQNNVISPTWLCFQLMTICK